MTLSNSAKFAFLGLNILRLVSLVTIILVFTTLIMGFVEDVRDYGSDAIMDEAESEDCAYVPGTSIPMQTWGIFWVELHRVLLITGIVSLFFAELSWFGSQKLEGAAQTWVPVLSRTRGLAAMGSVHVVIATSILSHYLDEFPLVVSWMLFVIGVIYLCLGIAFYSHPLKDGRSLFAHNRKQFVKGSASRVYRSFSNEKSYGATTGTTTLRKLFKRKGVGGKTRSTAVSINESFPSLEPESHKQVLADRARRAQHARKTSSVAVDMSGVEAVRTSITQDFVWNAHAGVVHERDPSNWQPERRDSQTSHQSFTSVASSTQIRIGGYASKEAALARERARRRRIERPHPPPAKSTGKAAAKVKSVKRKSVAMVNRLSAGTASALAARRRGKGIPNASNDVVVEYIEDESSAPPIPPLPAYHQAMRSETELPVASQFARSHVA